MTELVVRRLLIDLQSPFARDWCGGDAFSTAFFNALSMSFPFGEQFFIDAVRDAVATLPPETQEKHRAEVRGFIGQEARTAASTRCSTITSRARVWWTTGPRAPASALR
jgi:predicted metal-dependent hydrolase